MTTFRYIGSKRRVLDGIIAILGEESGGYFVDVFAGTGVVSRAAAENGWKVLANDHLTAAAIQCAAQLTAKEQAPFSEHGSYENAIRKLNALAPMEGFIYHNYTPASSNHSQHERKYFTQKNGARIDAVRQRVMKWQSESIISERERQLLIADLLVGADRVANTAGTYGAYLDSWSDSAKRRLRLQTRRLLPSSEDHIITCQDAFSVEADEADVAYLDPPYTKRQYAAYYHVLNTIARYDSPEVEGVTGLRPWQDLASPFCYKRKALEALTRLVDHLNPQRILISYNSDGHIELNDLIDNIGQFGRITLHALGSISQYTANGAGADVGEFLLELDKRSAPGQGTEQAKVALDKRTSRSIDSPQLDFPLE